MTDRPHAGDLLRQWRQRRRLSQLDLALAADVSPRHLSFVETGRSRPTSDMILRLANTSTSRSATATRCCWSAATPPPTRNAAWPRASSRLHGKPSRTC